MRLVQTGRTGLSNRIISEGFWDLGGTQESFTCSYLCNTSCTSSSVWRLIIVTNILKMITDFLFVLFFFHFCLSFGLGEKNAFATRLLSIRDYRTVLTSK
jgi:hypothetical protein